MNVARYNERTKLQFTVEFITPTFLGGANGDAEIRTAPFKNLLRRWWRIVKSDLDPEDLWKHECELFGSAADKNSTKSKVELHSVEPPQYLGEKGEVVDKDSDNEALSYLGYGVIDNKGAATKKYVPVGFKKQRDLTIKICSEWKLSLSFPSEYREEIIQTLYYIDCFGTIGTRSKKGFGSIAVRPGNFNFDNYSINGKNIDEIMDSKDEKNYPNSIVSDSDGFMIWTTEGDVRYVNVMKTFYDIYIRAKEILNLALLGAAKGSQLPVGAKRLPSMLTLKIFKDVNKYHGCLILTPYIVKGWNSKFWEQEVLKLCKFFDGKKSIKRWNVGGAK